MKSVGKIMIPRGTLVEPHELVVAKILSWTGHDVQFLPTSFLHTADILYCNREWEIKSPKGSSGRTIENNLRAALKQSKNVIMDLQRIRIPEKRCLATIMNRAKKLGKSYHILVITKSQALLEIS